MARVILMIHESTKYEKHAQTFLRLTYPPNTITLATSRFSHITLILNPIQKRYRTNQYIRITPVRVIDENGQNLGIMETADAQKLAEERGLDLIEIAPTVRPPVTKIMDFGKFKYEEEKKERQQKTKQKEVELKNIRIGFTTGKHDLELKAKQIREFLADGNKVRIDLLLRGRQKALRDFAYGKFGEFLDMVPNKEFESEVKRTPQGFITVIKPATGGKK